VLLNTINNAEGAFEWIREASVILIKLSRERETDGTRGLGGSVMISEMQTVDVSRNTHTYTRQVMSLYM